MQSIAYTRLCYYAIILGFVVVTLDDQRGFKKLAKGYALEALHTLAEIMQNPELPATSRVSAAKIIIERAYGTSTQELSETEDNSGEQLTFMFEIDE
jgi:hypothetical protein